MDSIRYHYPRVKLLAAKRSSKLIVEKSISSKFKFEKSVDKGIV
jgi:hypothetical protein